MEDDLILKIKDIVPSADANTIVGIGDDTAVINFKDSPKILATADMLMEDIHFRRSWGEFYFLGKKSIAQNISDIAAMGGIPVSALISIAVPEKITESNILEIYRGISDAAREYNITISGGDTIKSSDKLVISVAMLGSAGDTYPLRGGAKVGDIVAVTGFLGNASEGLRLLEQGIKFKSATEIERKLISAQLLPVPRVNAGRILSAIPVNAMMDISDGIGRDLRRICAMSNVGAVIYEENIPIDDDLRSIAEKPLQSAISGGEDFELLVTIDEEKFEVAKRALLPLKFTAIGKITAEKRMILQREYGENIELYEGFSHF